MIVRTTDLCDAHSEAVRIVAPLFRDFGARRHFAGSIHTVHVYEDNVLVRAALEQPGHGQVLVVDGGASLRCALLGDQMARLAYQNGWEGMIINGAIRDVEALSTIAIGIKALAPCPCKSGKRGWGERNVRVTFGGVVFTPGAWLVADADRIVVAQTALSVHEIVAP